MNQTSTTKRAIKLLTTLLLAHLINPFTLTATQNQEQENDPNQEEKYQNENTELKDQVEIIQIIEHYRNTAIQRSNLLNKIERRQQTLEKTVRYQEQKNDIQKAVIKHLEEKLKQRRIVFILTKDALISQHKKRIALEKQLKEQNTAWNQEKQKLEQKINTQTQTNQQLQIQKQHLEKEKNQLKAANNKLKEIMKQMNDLKNKHNQLFTEKENQLKKQQKITLAIGIILVTIIILIKKALTQPQTTIYHIQPAKKNTIQYIYYHDP